MTFFLLGIDHKAASIDIREAAFEKRKDVLAFWKERAPGRAAILSTCNRFEIYGVAESAIAAQVKVDLFKSHFDGLFGDSYFLYGQDKVLRHLARLAAGLESQVKGELQIRAQLNDWAAQKDFPEELAAMVRDALLLAHEIRPAPGSGLRENNIAILLYEYLLSKHDSDDLLNIVIAGTGKIAEVFAEYKPEEARLYFAAHKNISKARELAQKSQGHALLLNELPELLLKADILISATSSPHRIFGKDYFSRIAALRKKELYIYDLSVPRAVDPEAKNIGGIILKNIDEATQDAYTKSRDKAEQISR